MAIVLPAAILAVLGAVFLRQWAAASEAFFVAQARDMASMAAEKVEAALLRAEDEIVARLRSIARRDGVGAAALSPFLASTPLVARLYVVDHRGARLFPETEPAGEPILPTLLAEIPQGSWERGDIRHVVVAGQVVVASPITTREGTPALAAFTRDLEVLRREFLEAALGGLEGPTVLAVVDAAGRPVYNRSPIDRAERIVSVTFGEALPAWKAVLYEPPELSARRGIRRQITVFTGAFGLLLVVIVAGLVATYRLVRRETELARLKSNFVANVSHDLKTPLSLIRMYGETLELGRVAEESRRQDYYRVITRESERLSRLIDNVLDFSRIEGGRQEYEMTPTAVEPLVRETLEAFSYPLAQGGFKVDVAVAPDLPEVPLDPDAVGQALANLIDNAIKYSGERRVLRVDARIREGQLALAVADEGIGVPPEERARIFEKFYRVGRSETQGRRGSGVGLALVRHIVEAHAGRVTVESQPGVGSRFTLWLPLAARSG